MSHFKFYVGCYETGSRDLWFFELGVTLLSIRIIIANVIFKILQFLYYIQSQVQFEIY